jgi:hypothetical protein
MPPEERNYTIRSGRDRRIAEECQIHEDRLNEVSGEVSKQSGWLKASAIIVTIAMIIVSGFSGLILTKLAEITGMLSDTKVTLAQHTEKILTLDKRVSDVEERNKYIDQQSGMLGSRKVLNDSTTM